MINLFRSFVRDRRGAAAVEFAIIAPGMLGLLFGMIELNEMVTADNRVQNVAGSIADVISRDVAVTTTEVTNVFSAASTIIFPGSASGLKMRVSSVRLTGAGRGEVLWSDGSGFGPHVAGSNIDLPSTVEDPCSGPSIIYAEVSYDYRSPIGLIFGTGPIALTETSVMCPRSVENVARV